MALVVVVRHDGVGLHVCIQNQGCRQGSWSKGAGSQAEAPWTHYTLDMELVFGPCVFGSLLLLPTFS